MILLDTCTLLWLASGQSRLSTRAKAAINQGRGVLYVSAISAFEIALKHRKRRLTLPMAPERWYPAVLKRHGVREIPIDGEIATRSALLPSVHGDPADRIILATAMIGNFVIVTPDEIFREYRNVKVVW